jgi:pyrrolidone-carboxylate peptidase
MIKNSIVLTGFGPFGGSKLNISSEIVRNFPSKLQNLPIVKKKLQVSWEKSIKAYISLQACLKREPLLVVLLGIHSHKNYHIEKYGWNFRFGQDIERIFKFGPIMYNLLSKIKTILDVKQIFSALQDHSNMLISVFPGFYLCNFIYFSALYMSNQEYPVIFIHIPESEELTKGIMNIENLIRTIIKIHFKQNLDV